MVNCGDCKYFMRRTQGDKSKGFCTVVLPPSVADRDAKEVKETGGCDLGEKAPHAR